MPEAKLPAEPSLSEGLASPDPQIRRQTLLRLAGRPPDRRLLEVFLRIAQADPEPPVRLLARQLYQETKKSIGGEAAMGASLLDASGQFQTSNLSEVLDAGETSAKLEAIRQAIEAREPSALEIFRDRLGKEDDPWVLASLLKGLGTLGGSRDIHLIQPLLKHEDVRIQANAIEALELIGDELSFSLVAPMLQSKDDRIRANSIKCLVRFDPDEALATLERMAEAEQLSSRESAVYCLGILRHDQVPDIVAGMVARETSEDLLLRQLKILEAEGGRSCLGPMASLSLYLRGQLQEKAAMALGRVRSRVPVGEEELEELRIRFEDEFRRSGRHRPDALVRLPGSEEPATKGAEREIEDPLKALRRKPATAAEPPPPPSRLASIRDFFVENPSFAGLLGITSVFLVASVAVLFGPTEEAGPTRPGPTRQAIQMPTRKPTRAPAPTKSDKEIVTLECTVNNINPKRRTALLKHGGKILSVRLENEPRGKIERRDTVRIRGFYTGKVRFGAREFRASEISKVQ